MEVVATRKKQKDVTYVLIRNISLAVICFIMSGLSFFCSDPSILGIAIMGTFFGVLGVIFIILGIKDFRFNKRVNLLPEVALCKHYKKIVICNSEETTINLKDIIKIKARRYLKTSFGLSQYVSKEGVLKITTQDKTYKLENVEEVKEIAKILKDWANK